MSMGRAFHSLGAANIKARSPSVFLDLLIGKVSRIRDTKVPPEWWITSSFRSLDLASSSKKSCPKPRLLRLRRKHGETKWGNQKKQTRQKALRQTHRMARRSQQTEHGGGNNLIHLRWRRRQRRWRSNWPVRKMTSERKATHSRTHARTHALTHSLTHSLTHALTHTLKKPTLEKLTNLISSNHIKISKCAHAG